ncbi:MAG TPA: 50S ribosomal protein L25 [Actinomycetota bacterium]|nr:50S ribosomal protein L25 [Actinomycetota bacterium]
MEATLQAEPRTETGKGAAHRLRAAGRIPAILYGAGVDATPIQVNSLDLLHLMHATGGGSVLVDLKLDGQEYLTIAREIQRDLIHNRFIHVDFMAVNRDEKITVNVELHEIGESVGVHSGGVIEHHLREVELECLPVDVPERIEFDITNLTIGDSIRVGDLTAPPGVTFLTEADVMVLAVVEPAVMDTELDLAVAGEEAPEEAVEAEAEAPEGEVPEGEEGEGPEGEGGEAEAAEGEGGEAASAEGDGES